MTQTTHTRRAMGFAEAFERAVVSVEGMERYELRLTIPEGGSTGGGVRSVQHVTLASRTGGPPIVVGSLDQLTGVAELHPYRVIRPKLEQLFGRSDLHLTGSELEWLHGVIRPRLEALGFVVRLALARPAAPDPLAQPARPPPSTPEVRRPFIVLLCVALALWLLDVLL